MLKKTGLILGLSLIASTAGFAQDTNDDGPTWNYIEGGYTVLNFDDSDLKLRGVDLRGSFTIKENFFIAADFLSGTDNQGADERLNFFNVSAGVKYGLSNSTDIYIKGGFSSIRESDGSYSDTESGYHVGGGLKFKVASKLDLGASVTYTDLGNGYDSTKFGGSATYMFTEKMGLGVDVSRQEDITGFGAKLRLAF